MGERSTLLCVSNFPANTGFAWTMIEGLYARVADNVARLGIRTLVAFPRIDSPPATLEGSAANPLQLSLEPHSLGDLARLLRTIRRESVRTVYFTDRPARHWTYPLLRLAGVRRILLYDHTSGERSRPGPVKRVLKQLVARLPFYGVDLVLTVSDYVAKRHLEVTMTPPGRVRRLWNGVKIAAESSGDRERCGVPPEQPLLLCSCRAAPEKGVNHLLNAFDLLPRDGVPREQWPVLLFAGSGPAIEELEGVRRGLAHRDDVRFLGYRKDAERLNRGADLCVVPSVWQDALPLAVLEAMAMGKPVVATAVGGIPEMINSPSVGRLVPPGDPIALANAIAELLDNPEERLAIGEAARARVASEFRPLDQVDAVVAALGFAAR